MMTLNEVRAALQDRHLGKVANATGLHYETVRRVARSNDRQISYHVVKRLSDYLSASAVPNATFGNTTATEGSTNG